MTVSASACERGSSPASSRARSAIQTVSTIGPLASWPSDGLEQHRRGGDRDGRLDRRRRLDHLGQPVDRVARRGSARRARMRCSSAAHHRVGVEREPLVAQRLGAVELAGDLRLDRRLHEPARALGRRRASARRRGRTRARPSAWPPRRRASSAAASRSRGDVLVGGDRGGGEVPGARRARPRRAPSASARWAARRAGGAGEVVGGRAQQRVAEAHAAALDDDDPGRLGGVERARPRGRGGRSACDELGEVLVAAGRGDEQRLARGSRAARRAGGGTPASTDSPGGQHRRQRLAAGELRVAERGGQLEQRERVARGGRGELGGDRAAQAVAVRRGAAARRPASASSGAGRRTSRPGGVDLAARRRVADAERASRRPRRAAAARRRRSPRPTARRATARRRRARAPGRSSAAVPSRPSSAAGTANRARRARRPRARAPGRARAPAPAAAASRRCEQRAGEVGQAGERQLGLGLDARAPRGRACPRRRASRACSSSAVLPIPGSPRIEQRAAAPLARVGDAARSMRSTSLSRPMSMR